MDTIQLIAVSTFFLLYVFLLMRAFVRSQPTFVGTGGTVIVPLLAVVLVLFLDIDFYFTKNYVIESLGLMLIAGGSMLNFYAERYLQRNRDDFWTAQFKEKERYLVAEGPYRFIRHPVYTSMFLFFTGFLLILFHPLTVVFVVLYFGGMLITAFHEEKFLLKQFSKYTEYQKILVCFSPS